MKTIKTITCSECNRMVVVIYNPKTEQYHGQCENKDCEFYHVNVTHLEIEIVDN